VVAVVDQAAEQAVVVVDWYPVELVELVVAAARAQTD
jgi:hypothetical protein